MLRCQSGGRQGSRETVGSVGWCASALGKAASGCRPHRHVLTVAQEEHEGKALEPGDGGPFPTAVSLQCHLILCPLANETVCRSQLQYHQAGNEGGCAAGPIITVFQNHIQACIFS